MTTETEADKLLNDLKRYRFLLHNFPHDERLARMLLQLIAESEQRLSDLDVDVPRALF